MEGTGFSYGNIQVLLTPLPCSEYPGDLTALFDDVPDASASTGMSVRSSTENVFVF